MKTLTIFTPTYNRAYRLYECYESLVRQTCKDFMWLIIDDGSTDNTYELVKEWISLKNEFQIIYFFKENGGIHTVYNVAYNMITTELNMCIDSDDYIKDNAVELILNLWKGKKSEEYAGIIALDEDRTGAIIGSKLPDKKDIHLADFYNKGGKGDKKLIYRTDLMRKYPEYPVFEGEKYVSVGYKYSLVDRDYKLLILNHPICVVEYLEDGYTKNRYKKYIKNPKGFVFTKSIQIKMERNLLKKFKLCIQYTAFSLLAKNKHFLKNSPDLYMTIFAIPFGILLNRFIRYKARQ